MDLQRLRTDSDTILDIKSSTALKKEQQEVWDRHEAHIKSQQEHMEKEKENMVFVRSEMRKNSLIAKAALWVAITTLVVTIITLIVSLCR